MSRISDRETRRARNCRWDYLPHTYRVVLDDTFDQVRFQSAAQDLGLRDVSAFLRFAAEHVYRHNPKLKELRHNMRLNDREEQARKREEERERAEWNKRFPK